MWNILCVSKQLQMWVRCRLKLRQMVAHRQSVFRLQKQQSLPLPITTASLCSFTPWEA